MHEPSPSLQVPSEHSPEKTLNDFLLPFSREGLVLAGSQHQFFVCRSKIHVVHLTKWISLLSLPVYVALIVFFIYFGNATTTMFAAIIFGSVAAFTIYGAFRGSKLCLIPFIFLQLVFFIYDVVLVCLCLYGALRKDSYIAQSIGPELLGHLDTYTALLSLSLCLSLCLAPIVWTTHIVYLDFLFISELDETLEFLKEVNENCSKDDNSPPHKVNNF